MYLIFPFHVPWVPGKLPYSVTGIAQTRTSNFDLMPPMLDKKDEIWCYILVKLFTTILEDPQEAERMLKPTKSAFDVNLRPAVEQLRVAIEKKKSETSQIYNLLHNASSTVNNSRIGGKSDLKPEKSLDGGDISSSSGSSSSDDDESHKPQTSNSIWTQKNVEDSFRHLVSSAAQVDTKFPIEEILKMISSFNGK